MGQQKLGQYKAQPGSIFANLHWTPKPIDPIDPKLNHVDLSQVDEAKRQKVNRSALIRDALQRHLKRLRELELEEQDRRGYLAKP